MKTRFARSFNAALLAATALASTGWAGVDIPPECRKPGVTLLPLGVRQVSLPYGSMISKDGKSAYFIDPLKGEPFIKNLQSGTLTPVRWKNAPESGKTWPDFVQTDGRTVVRITPAGEIWVMDATTGKATPFGSKLPEQLLQNLKMNGLSRLIVSPDRNTIVVENGTALVAFGKSGTITRHSIRVPANGGGGFYGSLTTSVAFLDDGTVRYASSGGVLQVTDWNPSNGNVTPKFDSSKIQWKALGGKVDPLVYGLGYPGSYGNGLAGGMVGGMPPATSPQKTAKDKESIRELKYSARTGEIILTTSEGRRLIQGIEPGSEARVEPVVEIQSLSAGFGIPIQADERGLFQTSAIVSGNLEQVLNQIEGVTCIDPSLTVAAAGGDCLECRSGTGLQQSSTTQLAQDLATGQLCSSPFEAKSWDKATGPIAAPSEKRPISRERAELLWLRFQKTGGMEPQKHGSILVSLLRSDLAKNDPAGTRAILQNVQRSSKILYAELAERMPELLRICTMEPESRPRCQTDQERQAHLATAKTLLESLEKPIRESPQAGYMVFPTTFSQWQRLAPFSNLLATLPAAEKDEHIDFIGQNLADSAAMSPQYRDVFLSKLYKFTSHSVAPLFGEKPKALTDLTYTRDAAQVTPVVLSSGTLEMNDEAELRNPYGFYSKALDPISAPAMNKTETQSIAWKSDGRSYSADLSVRALEKKDIIPKDTAPKYDELWKDGRLSGMVVVGSNLKGSSASLMQEYLAYYQSKGFRFSDTREEMGDFTKHLEAKTASGELDYLIKEAHSDGDEKNLFRMDSRVKILRGERTIPGTSRKESVELVYPTDDSKTAESKLVSNQAFGEWIRKREQDGKGQFVYFNTSCWSHTKALHEIEAARSTNLLNIPTQTSACTFVHEGKQNGLHQVLEGFRNQETYQQVRARLEPIPKYKDQKEDVYLFPDEPRYQELITKKIATPLDIRLQVRDEKGRPYSIEEGH
jgi:hypothetical protein